MPGANPPPWRGEAGGLALPGPQTGSPPRCGANHAGAAAGWRPYTPPREAGAAPGFSDSANRVCINASSARTRAVTEWRWR